LSFVSSGGRPPAAGGCAADGGRVSVRIAGVAASLSVTGPGGTPSTASRCTTSELFSSTATAYSVVAGDSDCTGATLA
jgi:hypothetical protein